MGENPAAFERLGAYQIEALLGQGGMGAVYSAWDERLQRRVAIKRLPAAKRFHLQLAVRLRREARAIARLKHPAIVEIYDLIESEGGDHLVMELVEGHSLDQLVENSTISPERAIDWTRQIAEGLGEAHDKGLVHRDLKPQNVMVTSTGVDRVKILDFGLALWMDTIEQAEETITEPGRLMGTLHAMSPEQAAGLPLDPRSDLFSLGGLLYYLLAGRMPFVGNGVVDVLRRVTSEAPEPLPEHCHALPTPLLKLLGRLLEKDPERRPATAQQVAEELTDCLRRPRIEEWTGITDTGLGEGKGKGRDRDKSIPSWIRDSPTHADSSPIEPALRVWPLPDLPAEPYPLLLPYHHPDLMAGRNRELAQLKEHLALPIPILGLFAASGIGKSSLLGGGLVPHLRREGWPVAWDRHPHEPGLARRLIGDLLVEPATLVDEPRAFVECLVTAQRISGHPPILVLDQFEECLRPRGDQLTKTRRARTALGILLAASVERHPGVDEPVCRWLLAYRQEDHGNVVTWLRDVLRDVLREIHSTDLAEVKELPRDLSGPARFHSFPLAPLGAPLAINGQLSGLEREEAVRQIFQAAIETPLALCRSDGRPAYAERFADGDAERLARAFAKARLIQPEAPLAPEFQVTLAHLRNQAHGDRGGGEQIIHVPQDLDRLIQTALDAHLERALETAFPAQWPNAPEDRARALLALRELVNDDVHASDRDRRSDGGRKNDGLPAAALVESFGAGGRQILEKLAAPAARLIVLERRSEGWYYILAHDQLARLIVQRVELEGRGARLPIDGELLALRRFVALTSALYETQPEAATRLPAQPFRRIATHGDVLLRTSKQRRWWAACQNRHQRDRRHNGRSAALALILLSMVATLAGGWAHRRSTFQALEEQIISGEPKSALSALAQLAARPTVDWTRLKEIFAQRDRKSEVLENGLDEAKSQGMVVLQAVEVALPLASASAHDIPLLASLLWALDFGPARDPTLRDAARELRRRLISPLHRQRPPTTNELKWVTVPGGTFRMGGEPGPDRHRDETPRHDVTISPFKMLAHEVTHGEYRQLFDGPASDDELPITGCTWYEAYVFAAWLGGRLPTEAEWEYAARAGCLSPWCGRDGRPVSVSAVGWTLRDSLDSSLGKPRIRRIAQREPNPLGLFDLHGNAWEWTTDWYADYSSNPQQDPWGPSTGIRRVVRGGGFRSVAAGARASFRGALSPDARVEFQGFRVILPIDEHE